VRIIRYGTVKFLIGSNKPEINTGVYETKEIRYFYLLLTGKNTNIESNRLKQGESFSHTF